MPCRIMTILYRTLRKFSTNNILRTCRIWEDLSTNSLKRTNHGYGTLNAKSHSTRSRKPLNAKSHSKRSRKPWMPTLTSNLSLTLYIIVASDANSYGIGACIVHKLPDGSRKDVEHASRSLLPSEKQYSQIEKEALEIIFVVTKLHRYLHVGRFIIQTDHKPLISIFGSKKGLPVYTANRLLRWGKIISNYNFKIEFLTSKNICHGGSLSRLLLKIRKFLKNQLLQLQEGICEIKTMFARKIKSVFDKLIPQQAKFKKTVSPHKKHFFPGDKVVFKAYKNNMTFWEIGTTKLRIGELVYIVKGPKTRTNAIWTSSGNAVSMNLRNHHLRRVDRRNIRSFRSRHASSLSGSMTLGKKIKIYATTRRKSQEEEISIFFFSKKKKRKFLEVGVVRPKFTCIMDSSSTILLAL